MDSAVPVETVLAAARTQQAAGGERHLAGDITQGIQKPAGASVPLELVDVDENAAGELAVADDANLRAG